MKTIEEKLDAIIANEIEYLTSLCKEYWIENKYDELYQIVLEKFGYKNLSEEDINKEYNFMGYDDENDGDNEPDYDAKTAQERAEDQREIYRTLK
jgi:adenine-specific DNA methylase